MGGGEDQSAAPRVCWGAALSSSGTGVPVCGQAVRLPVIPSPRLGGMKRFDGPWSAGSISGATTPGGGHDLHDPRRPAPAASSGQGAHVMVTDRVVDESELFARGGDDTDGASTPDPDTFPHRADVGGLGQDLY